LPTVSTFQEDEDIEIGGSMSSFLCVNDKSSTGTGTSSANTNTYNNTYNNTNTYNTNNNTYNTYSTNIHTNTNPYSTNYTDTTNKAINTNNNLNNTNSNNNTSPNIEEVKFNFNIISNIDKQQKSDSRNKLETINEFSINNINNKHVCSEDGFEEVSNNSIQFNSNNISKSPDVSNASRCRANSQGMCCEGDGNKLEISGGKAGNGEGMRDAWKYMSYSSCDFNECDKESLLEIIRQQKEQIIILKEKMYK